MYSDHRVFVKHLLCKVSRWKGAFVKNKQDFARFAREAVKSYNGHDPSIEPLIIQRVLAGFGP